MLSTLIIPFRFTLWNSWVTCSFLYFRAILFKSLGNCTTRQIFNSLLDYLISFMLSWIVYFGLFRWILCDERKFCVHSGHIWITPWYWDWNRLINRRFQVVKLILQAGHVVMWSVNSGWIRNELNWIHTFYLVHLSFVFLRCPCSTGFVRHIHGVELV